MAMTRITGFLDNDFTEPIRDPLWNNIYFPPCFEKVLKSKDFLELHGIKQLGPTYLVYPGATHSRYSHSLGVYHIAYRMVRRFVGMAHNIPFTLEGVKAFLLACLLHDLGHYPFAHSLKDIGVKDHEQLTGEIILSSSLKDILLKDCGCDPLWVAQIVDSSLACDNPELAFYRKVLSGVLDPDKLDYLNRDAYFCGVPYGKQDVDHILNEIIPLQDHGIAITTKGIISVESLLFSKYLMYKTIYWHKNVRIATAMIKKAMIQGLTQGIIKAEALYGLQDQGLLHLAEASHSPLFKLILDVFQGKLYKQVFRTVFNPENALHRKLEDLKARGEWEKKIFDQLKDQFSWLTEEMLILDIPEPISFETNLPVIDPQGPLQSFKQTASLFKDHSSENFVYNLRFLALYAPGAIISVRASDNEKFSAEIIKLCCDLL